MHILKYFFPAFSKNVLLDCFSARKNQVEVSAAQDSDSFGEEQSENEEEKPLESIKTVIFFLVLGLI